MPSSLASAAMESWSRAQEKLSSVISVVKCLAT